MSKILGILISLHHFFSQDTFFILVVVSGFLLIYPLMRKPEKRKFTEEQERLIVKGTAFINLFVYLAAVSLVELAYLSSLYFSGETSGGEHPSLKMIFVAAFFVWGMIRCGAITLKRWRGDRTGRPIFFEWKTVVLTAMFFSFGVISIVFQENTFQSKESFTAFLLLIPMFCFLVRGYWSILSDRYNR